ncbi:hypothetical protein MMPV_009829 [Pyropia vietnamensis]
MRPVRTISVAAAALAISVGTAFSADVIEPPIYQPPPEVVPVSVGGWYLRGDIGYAHMQTHDVRYFQGTNFTGRFEKHDFSSTWMIGGGIGYQATDYFRVDATLNHYFETDFEGSSATGAACNGAGVAGEICNFEDNAEVNVTTLMANAYFDLGNFKGITPYVGAGIGGAYVHWGDLFNDETCILNCGAYVEQDATHSGYQEWHFAWALHTGLTYDYSSNIKFDLGYSYTHIEGGRMFAFAAGGGSGPQGFNDDIKIHEVKAGLRYSFH